ncbi:hypothetical protein Daus18300_008056 [Diaporthe australafricana]|uniref:SRR1-like domain-containing protein n=1 Tax=Diaporthe australafricana TaxID=127596 RepID=A0ABR3WKA6_9PEZI
MLRVRDTITNQGVPWDLQATKEAFDAGVKAWEDSEECRKLTSALMEHTTPDNITKILAFACGSILDNDLDQRRRTANQHASILTIKRVLQTKNAPTNVEIECYAQNPAYTGSDRTVLEGAGIRVLEDPHVFLEVDDSSVVLSFAPTAPVRQIVADLARPAFMIWNKVKGEDETLQFWSDFWPDRTWGSLEELEGIL